ncbi:hypothetical protein BCR36DRAFT_585536 [Piromyces finnis]|uniref:Uncharacterized protein n=1 Tax=Piromyces finnis TaxID=1754191 RepID=A0A1Y1V3P5_9FUNG|nr:hypothetical protein BCR36DRAFT_585536 [Piromyces finnis]|eukprot:ORX45780.1 hypothetical protein BCR36DRAFT_585536 [Piromyces finnis]
MNQIQKGDKRTKKDRKNKFPKFFNDPKLAEQIIYNKRNELINKEKKEKKGLNLVHTDFFNDFEDDFDDETI